MSKILKFGSILFLAMLVHMAGASTWYVNGSGGTRWSSAQPFGQCDGTVSASYVSAGGTTNAVWALNTGYSLGTVITDNSGNYETVTTAGTTDDNIPTWGSTTTSGTAVFARGATYPVNQHCAFGDIRYFWTDFVRGGTYAWIGAGGDTYLVDCSGMPGGSCRIGYSGAENNSGDYAGGIAGDPYSSGAPIPPSGTSGAHTQIFGINHASCSSPGARAQINGGFGVKQIFNLSGVSYIDFACFDETDRSACGKGNQVNHCSTSFPLSDFADDGILTNRLTTNTTLTDVNIHGMATNGMLGATGDGVAVTRVSLEGNADAGWNMDNSDGTTGTGHLTMSYFSVQWSGCAEEYPIVDSLPYQDCTDDNGGGYGDGVGTATVASSPAWLMSIDHSLAAYNTQDGFDLLHLTGTGSQLTVTTSVAYSNMGQQFKIGQAGIVINNQVVGNCAALAQAIPGTPSGYNSHLSDFCRAGDSAIALAVQDSVPTIAQFNTVMSDGQIAWDVVCGANGASCTGLESLQFQNNIFFGFGDTTPLNLDGSNGDISNLFSLSGSLYTYNATDGWGNGYAGCPQTAWSEAHYLCTDPGLVDETDHLYGIGNMAPASGSSAVVAAGITISGVTTDFAGMTRPSPPSIGALEFVTSGGGTTVNGTVSFSGTVSH